MSESYSRLVFYRQIMKHVFGSCRFKCNLRSRNHDDEIGVAKSIQDDGGLGGCGGGPSKPSKPSKPTKPREVPSCTMVLDDVIGGHRLTGVSDEHIRLAEIVWDYMLMHHVLKKSDLILVLGNHDVRVAQHAARLWLDGYAEYIMFTGYLGNMTEGRWTRPEYVVFREEALKMGVPSDRILVETKATNTGQNIRLSYEVLKNLQNGPKTTTTTAPSLLPLRSVILVQTPYMERRTYATFMKQWPEETSGIRVHVTSPDLYLRQYPNPEVGTLQDIICILIGNFQRMLIYPAKGYQIWQDVPDNVVKAYNGLADAGLYGRFGPTSD